MVKTNVSDYISAGILCQYDKYAVLWPIVFYFKKYSPAEYNYKIYNKEWMTIIHVFEHWHPKLQNSAHPIKIIINQKNLKYFMII